MSGNVSFQRLLVVTGKLGVEEEFVEEEEAEQERHAPPLCLELYDESAL